MTGEAMAASYNNTRNEIIAAFDLGTLTPAEVDQMVADLCGWGARPADWNDAALAVLATVKADMVEDALRVGNAEMWAETHMGAIINGFSQVDAHLLAWRAIA